MSNVGHSHQTTMELADAKKARVIGGQYDGRTIADVGRSKAGRAWLHNARHMYPVREGIDITDNEQCFAVAIRVYLTATE